MKKWEYKTVFGTINDRKLNEFGKDGWELIVIESPNSILMERRYYFKREIQ
jgi:hypothetical protein